MPDNSPLWPDARKLLSFLPPTQSEIYQGFPSKQGLDSPFRVSSLSFPILPVNYSQGRWELPISRGIASRRTYAQLLVLHPLYGQYRAFPNDNICKASFLIFIAAFMSRSWVVLQCTQVQFLTSSGKLPTWFRQTLQVLELGKNLSTSV